MTYKTSTSIFVAFLLCVSSAAQEKVSSQRDYLYLVDRIDGIYIPKDMDEAIDSLDVIISPGTNATLPTPCLWMIFASIVIMD